MKSAQKIREQFYALCQIHAISFTDTVAYVEQYLNASMHMQHDSRLPQHG
jgi:hypothetical protein